MPDGYVTEERAEELFYLGAQAMREACARLLDRGGDASMIRTLWQAGWGEDPGELEGDIPRDCWSA